MTLVMAEGAGLVDFAIIPHVEYDDQQDVANAEKWAGRLPVPTYAVDDDTAIRVIDGTDEVVSEGDWKLFTSLRLSAMAGPPAAASRRLGLRPG